VAAAEREEARLYPDHPRSPQREHRARLLENEARVQDTEAAVFEREVDRLEAQARTAELRARTDGGAGAVLAVAPDS